MTGDDVGHVPAEYLGWNPNAERDNRARLRHARTVHCARLPGCPAEHHPDCPRYPPRWATTNYQEAAVPETVYPACEHRPDTTIEQTTPCETCSTVAILQGVVDQAAADLNAATEAVVEAAAQVPAGPEPLFAGTFAIYGEPGGGVVLVVQDQDGKVERKRIPAALVRMGMQAMEGTGMVGRILKRGS